MAEQSVIVLDNFYKDPEAIRKLAYTLEYKRKPNAAYPGEEAFAPGYDWTAVKEELRNHIQENVDAPSPKSEHFHQGKFRIAVNSDQSLRGDLVHEDVQKWSAVVYLTLPEHCQGGVAFYKHKKTGALNSTREWFNQNFSHILDKESEDIAREMKKTFRDQSLWEMIGQIPMRYNRVVLLMGQCFHGSTGIFGHNKESGRLTQHFEFYSPEDGNY